MIYVTSDWHGYSLEHIKKLFEKVNFSEDDYCFVLGDVIDRGMYGVDILLWLMEQENIQLIMGNHEDMMLSCAFLYEEVTDEFIEELTAEKIDLYSNWVRNGGESTIRALRELDAETRADVVDFLNDTPHYDMITVGDKDYLLTHSGLGNFEKGKRISQYTPYDLLWNRPYINQRYFDKTITVFGHTPTLFYGAEYEGKPLLTDTWIDIDVGCAAGLEPMLFRLDDYKAFYLNHKMDCKTGEVEEY